MNNFFKLFKLDGLLNEAQEYIDNKITIVKTEVFEKVILIVTLLIISASVLFLFLMMLGFFSLALGHYLNDVFSSTFLGFLIMGLLFLFLMVGLIMLKGAILKKIHHLAMNMLDKKL